MRESVLPTVREEEFGGENEPVFEHPAFGVVTLSVPQGSIGPLFGSDLDHSQAVCFTVHRARLHRRLNHDYIHATETLCQFEVSHAQFSELITSFGKGSGTPVTLRRTESDFDIPGIAREESKTDTLEREVGEAARRTLDEVEAQKARIVAMLESGKISKTELRDVAWNLDIALRNAGVNMSFVVNQARRTAAQAASAARIEVETFISFKARQLGMESIASMIALPKAEEPKLIEGESCQKD